MAVTIVEYTTAAKATANCYTTRTKADAYFNDDTRYTIWASFDNETKDRALISATRSIDAAPLGAGKLDPATPQATRFPLAGMQDAIPICVRDACHEEAIDLLTNPQRDYLNSAKHNGITNFSNPGSSMSIGGGVRKICYRAHDLLARYISVSAGMV